VLARKGSLRRAENRRALARCAPFWLTNAATGGSGGIMRLAEIAFRPYHRAPLLLKTTEG
jgi:hypothetical protein